jgi:hypothetical protein
MDKTIILCDQDRDLLYEFSKRTVERIAARFFGAPPVPLIADYVEDNVEKEVEKDRLIIEGASSDFASGLGSDGTDIDALFEATKTVDRKFIRKLVSSALSVQVRYDDIAEIRKQRIKLITNAVHRLLRDWSGTTSLEDRLRETYPEEELREILIDMLHLYNLETRILTRSVGFLHILDPALRLLSGMLFTLMEEVSKELVGDCIKRIYGKETHHV